MNNRITLGSLFDGSGGFPLAGIMCGIEPLWASEIDPFCVSVTSKRIPSMQHLGDITKIKGAEIPPVDVITFGSPCQDLSVAGKRAGLDGERSGLFMEAVRIIKEMRGATNGEYPKIIIWENVPGAFSSNKGEDFRTVLEEIVKIKDTNVSIPRPPKGKWQTAGCIMGDGCSLAWRVLDAQFWGVPQRRKRIFLDVDAVKTVMFGQKKQHIKLITDSGIEVLLFNQALDFTKLVYDNKDKNYLLVCYGTFQYDTYNNAEYDSISFFGNDIGIMEM